MKKAIITGSTGLIGMATARHLSDAGIHVLCIGRRNLSPSQIMDSFGDHSTYLALSMERISSRKKRSIKSNGTRAMIAFFTILLGAE